MSQEVSVRTFQTGDEIDFRRLNVSWIAKYFGVEAKDLEAFENPKEKIIATGGEVFLATIDEVTVGCVALIRLSNGEFEVAKMATDESYQRRGIGRALMNAAIQWARAHRAKRLYLETNHTLEAAQRLYAAAGFRRIPPQPSPYKRADVFMELLLD